LHAGSAAVTSSMLSVFEKVSWAKQNILEAEGKISSDMENLVFGIDLLVQQIPNVAELH